MTFLKIEQQKTLTRSTCWEENSCLPKKTPTLSFFDIFISDFAVDCFGWDFGPKCVSYFRSAWRLYCRPKCPCLGMSVEPEIKRPENAEETKQKGTILGYQECIHSLSIGRSLWFWEWDSISISMYSSLLMLACEWEWLHSSCMSWIGPHHMWHVGLWQTFVCSLRSN